jgi:hypothetical protein
MARPLRVGFADAVYHATSRGKALGYRNPSSVTAACRRVEKAMRPVNVRQKVEKLLADAAANR